MNLTKIENFIDKQKVSFICSVDEQNYPNVKAMLKPRKRNGLKEFYFSTNTSSARVKQYQSNPNASIYFYRKGLIKYVGVMLKGKMEVLTDQETKNMLWKTKFPIVLMLQIWKTIICGIKLEISLCQFWICILMVGKHGTREAF